MRLESYRSAELARGIARRIGELAARLDRPVALMEVCGTHTVALARHGLKTLLPPTLRLLSGPGCPVCVTAQRDLDRAIALAAPDGERPRRLLTFGDMLRVPGSAGSLETARARGAKVEIVYSPFAAVEAARAAPEKEIVFLGVGFETTAPAIAAMLQAARAEKLANLSVLPLLKVLPPALRALLASGEAGAPRLDGLLLPGHVSAIIGARPYEFLAREFGLPGVIAGFEPVDILDGIRLLLEQLVARRAAIEIAYRRVVAPEGNPEARRLLAEVFAPADAEWRGLGLIPGSGLRLAPEYAAFDADARFPLAAAAAAATGADSSARSGCRCGEILRGRLEPRGCPLFGRACTPERPLGPCMVSSEGACAAEFQYGGGGEGGGARP